MSTRDDLSHHGGAYHHSLLVTSAHATLHCLIGCGVGEAAGLVIGIALAWGAVATIALAVVLAYVCGFAMALVPVMKQARLGLAAEMRVIWLGEAISIAVMEIAMNGVDYWLGGIQVASIRNALFWLGLAAAVPAGFLAAWPVNHLLLRHELKAGH